MCGFEHSAAPANENWHIRKKLGRESHKTRIPNHDLGMLVRMSTSVSSKMCNNSKCLVMGHMGAASDAKGNESAFICYCEHEDMTENDPSHQRGKDRE